MFNLFEECQLFFCERFFRCKRIIEIFGNVPFLVRPFSFWFHRNSKAELIYICIVEKTGKFTDLLREFA